MRRLRIPGRQRRAIGRLHPKPASSKRNISPIRSVPGLPGWVQLTPPDDHQPYIHLQPVPEPKAGKVRIHHGYPQGAVVVLADPGGNEFRVAQRN